MLVALSVGLDNFAAATAMGVSGTGDSGRLRIAIVFGFFEAAMPIVGLLLGHSVSRDLGGSARLIGGLLLVAAGFYAILHELLIDTERPKHKEILDLRQVGIRRLLVLGLALSIDNLVVGFGLGTYHVSVVVAVALMAVVSVGLSLLGLELGNRMEKRLGERSGLFGAGILIIIGIAIASHIL